MSPKSMYFFKTSASFLLTCMCICMCLQTPRGPPNPGARVTGRQQPAAYVDAKTSSLSMQESYSLSVSPAPTLVLDLGKTKVPGERKAAINHAAAHRVTLKYFLLIRVMFISITPEFTPVFPQYGCRAKRLYHPIRGSSCSGAIAAICVELNFFSNDQISSTGRKNRISVSTQSSESTSFRINYKKRYLNNQL